MLLKSKDTPDSGTLPLIGIGQKYAFLDTVKIPPAAPLKANGYKWLDEVSERYLRPTKVGYE